MIFAFVFWEAKRYIDGSGAFFMCMCAIWWETMGLGFGKLRYLLIYFFSLNADIAWFVLFNFSFCLPMSTIMNIHKLLKSLSINPQRTNRRSEIFGPFYVISVIPAHSQPNQHRTPNLTVPSKS